MTETETKIDALISKFEQDVENVSQHLRSLTDSESIDSISAAKSDEEKPVPYALSAYALSSMLFAYLRSEGEDVAPILPELARVKEKVETLASSGSAPSGGSRPKEDARPVNKHVRFGEEKEQPPKKLKKTKKSKSG